MLRGAAVSGVGAVDRVEVQSTSSETSSRQLDQSEARKSSLFRHSPWESSNCRAPSTRSATRATMTTTEKPLSI